MGNKRKPAVGKAALGGCVTVALGCASSALAQDDPTYTLYGTPGLIEMPSAQMAQDGDIAVTFGTFGDHQRTNFTFQIAPRLSGTFRYTTIDNFDGDGSESFNDRSLDLSYQLVREGAYLPAISIGLQDFVGTGIYGGEYVVASKTVADRLTVTGGLGWGRLGSEGGFDNPLGFLGDDFDERPADDYDDKSSLTDDRWFRGDAALFGGVEYRFTDALSVKAEYSSDAYERSTAQGTFEPDSPYNFGLTYRPNEVFQLGLYSLYGSEVGFAGSVVLNPRERPNISGNGQAPLPVNARPDRAAGQSWTDMPTSAPRDALTQRAAMNQLLEADGITLLGLEVEGDTARVRFSNNRYPSLPQAMGHIARAMTHALPPEIETFVLEPEAAGIGLSSVTLQRSDIEQLENRPNATQLSFDRAIFAQAGGEAGINRDGLERDRFNWGIKPYLSLSNFDADDELRADVGLELSASYAVTPSFVFSGSIRQRLAGNRDEGTAEPASDVQPVRSNGALYSDPDTVLETLQAAYYFRPGENLYGRVSAGYLERMFGGISTEILYAPPTSNLAFGLEVNQVTQRDYDGGLRFLDYDVTTGHVSAYYDFDNGYETQIDVGKYLAGDWGATVALDREFANGWRVGGYVTVTDLDEEGFDDGAFSNGVKITIPTGWFIGQPTRRTNSINLRSTSRDAGARLGVDGRLNGLVSESQQPDLEERWGRFWR